MISLNRPSHQFRVWKARSGATGQGALFSGLIRPGARVVGRWGIGQSGTQRKAGASGELYLVLSEIT